MSAVAMVRRNGAPGWAVIARSAAGGGWSVVSATVADGRIYVKEEFAGLLQRHPHSDLSFSTRTADQFIEQPGETPEVVAGAVPGVGITLMIHEGVEHNVDRMVTLWRSHTGVLTGSTASRFMRINLAEKVEKWFSHDGAEHKQLRNLELWIRGGREWHARALLPDAFPVVVPQLPSPQLLADRKAHFGKMRADAAAQAAVQREKASAKEHQKAQDQWMKRRLKGGAA